MLLTSPLGCNFGSVPDTAPPRRRVRVTQIRSQIVSSNPARDSSLQGANAVKIFASVLALCQGLEEDARCEFRRTNAEIVCDSLSSLAFYLNYQTRLDSASRFLGRLSWVDGRGM